MSPSLVELRTLLRMSLPVALTQLGVMMSGVVDTLMVGRLGVTELAACALGNMVQWASLSFGMGLVMGIDPLVSQAHGRRDGPGTALALQRGIVLALVVSVPLSLILWFTEQSLLLLGQDARVAALAGSYNRWKLPTVMCFLVYSAIRTYLQGRTLMAAATWVMWIGNAVHVPLNGMLIFGWFGAPALGLTGAALASSGTTLLELVGLVLWTRAFRLHEGAWRAWDGASFDRRGLLQAARLGLPVGAQMTLEATAFAIATLMAGWIDEKALASHHVVLNMAALAFMVPLGVSQGASARIGNLIGARDETGMRRSAVIALVLGAGVMTLSAATFTLLRHELPRLYTSEPTIVHVSATILPYAAAFQLFDGTQVVAGGLLRGMGRPDSAALANLLGYYAFGLPLSYVLAFSYGFGLAGIWTGLVAGLAAVAALLVERVSRTARRPIAELEIASAQPTGP
jgi:MATE family multidrug resistance protein